WLTRSPACTIQCAAFSLLAVPGCWNWRHPQAVLKLFSRRSCAAVARCAYRKFPSLFVIGHAENRKCRSASRCDFFSAGCARCFSMLRAAYVPVKTAQDWLAQGRLYIQRLQESRAEASRQTWLELSPSTTTITSLPGRVPLAIKHLPAASV